MLALLPAAYKVIYYYQVVCLHYSQVQVVFHLITISPNVSSRTSKKRACRGSLKGLLYVRNCWANRNPTVIHKQVEWMFLCVGWMGTRDNTDIPAMRQIQGQSSDALMHYSRWTHFSPFLLIYFSQQWYPFMKKDERKLKSNGKKDKSVLQALLKEWSMLFTCISVRQQDN